MIEYKLSLKIVKILDKNMMKNNNGEVKDVSTCSSTVVN